VNYTVEGSRSLSSLFTIPPKGIGKFPKRRFVAIYFEQMDGRGIDSPLNKRNEWHYLDVMP